MLVSLRGGVGGGSVHGEHERLLRSHLRRFAIQLSCESCQMHLFPSIFFRKVQRRLRVSRARTIKHLKTVFQRKEQESADKLKNRRVLMYTRFFNTKTRHPLPREGQRYLALSLPSLARRTRQLEVKSRPSLEHESGTGVSPAQSRWLLQTRFMSPRLDRQSSRGDLPGFGAI